MMISNKIHVVPDDFDVLEVIKNVTESVRELEEAFYVCDLSEVVRRHKQLLVILPRVTPHYAVKCNPEMAVLKVLAAIGSNFDCASRAEMRKIVELGVGGERIIFANPTKPRSHLLYARDHRIKRMTFDNEDELHKVKRLFPDAELLLRFRCDAKEADCILGEKFGCDPTEEGPDLLRLAKSLSLNVVGVAFHVGSGCQEIDVFARAIRLARHLFDLARQIGYKFNLLDLGGGMPGEKDSSIAEFAATINAALDEHFPDDGSVRVISEPGKYCVTAAFTLATNVIGRRKVVRPTPHQDRVMYYVNESTYCSFLIALLDLVLPTPRYLHKSSEKLIPSTIWGWTCDSCDRLISGLPMPELELGDWIVFENMGAYSMALATDFQGLDRPTMIYLIDESTWGTLRHLGTFAEDDFTVAEIDYSLSQRESEDKSIKIDPHCPKHMVGKVPANCSR